MVQWELSGTLRVSQDQTLIVWSTAYGGGRTSMGSQGSGINKDTCFTLNNIDNHAVCYSIDHVVTGGGNCTAQGPCYYREVCPTMKSAGTHAVAICLNDQGGGSNGC